MAENKPIIRVVVGKPKEAWFSLSIEERKEVYEKAHKNFQDVGAKKIVVGNCVWSTEWHEFHVEEFPDIEALQEHAKVEDELGFMRYFEVKVYLGTRRK